jgi:hypothetical protein
VSAAADVATHILRSIADSYTEAADLLDGSSTLTAESIM